VLDGNFDSIGKSFGNMLKRMIAESAAADLGRFLLGDFAKTGSVGGVFGSIFGSLFCGARASGGPVTGGVPYLVGERGPELFVPKSSGGIVPNGSMGGVSITQHISVSGGASRGEVMTAMSVAKEAAKREIAESMRRGGVFA
jgi:phage-related minor tail protein